METDGCCRQSRKELKLSVNSKLYHFWYVLYVLSCQMWEHAKMIINLFQQDQQIFGVKCGEKKNSEWKPKVLVKNLETESRKRTCHRPHKTSHAPKPARKCQITVYSCTFDWMRLKLNRLVAVIVVMFGGKSWKLGGLVPVVKQGGGSIMMLELILLQNHHTRLSEIMGQRP